MKGIELDLNYPINVGKTEANVQSFESYLIERVSLWLEKEDSSFTQILGTWVSTLTGLYLGAQLIRYLFF